MRVMIALEHPATSDFLRGMVQEEYGAVIVGQAESVTKSLMLARKLRPDVAIIDCYLPYMAGPDKTPHSQIGGLDAAQVISEEMPNTRVMVLNNLDDVKIVDSYWNSDTVVSFVRETLGNSIPLTLRELSRGPKNSPVFARVEAKKRIDVKQKGLAIIEEVSLFGGIGILCGLIMMVTGLLLIPGIFIASVGVTVLAIGLAAKYLLGKLLKEDSK
jgi:CheY-like chemotaxis protein